MHAALIILGALAYVSRNDGDKQEWSGANSLQGLGLSRISSAWTAGAAQAGRRAAVPQARQLCR